MALALRRAALVVAVVLAAGVAHGAPPKGTPPPSLLLARGRKEPPALRPSKQGSQQDRCSAYMASNGATPISFRTIALVVLCDLLIYGFLPEGERFGPLAKRMPRLAWSVLMGTVALAAELGPSAPWLPMLLTLLLASSAATDLLFWLPFYAFTIEWEKCSGGFITKRRCRPHNPYDRFLLFALCFATGVFYAISAVHTQGVFQFLRDDEGERRMGRSVAAGIRLEAGGRHRG